jgi:TonB family protein
MKDVRTPLILWICAAISVHFVFGGGGVVVADIHDDRVYLHHLATDVRDRVAKDEATFDVALLDSSKTTKEEPPAPPPPPPPPPKPEEKAKKQPPPPPKVAKNEKKAEPKKEEKKPVLVVKEDAKPLPPPPPQMDKRIAVRQHAKPDQEDNPDAKFIADEANKVEKESVAEMTSHDRDDENPTPGGNHPGPSDAPGNSDRTKIADSEEHDGDKNRAPGERGRELTVQKDPMPKTPPAAQNVEGPKTAYTPQSGGDGRTAQTPSPQPTPMPMAPGAAGAQSPDVNQSADGSWVFNPVRPTAGQGVAKEAGPGAAPRDPSTNVPPTSTAWLGLGGKPGPGQINLNLTQVGVVASVGADQLRKEREADGERRRTEHRGSWIASGFERWRSAIENYVSSVKPGNQTALNTARVPFASYLNAMHNRIHPIFADNFLETLDGLPANHPLNDQHLITRLEIVLTKQGHLQRMGVVRTSGITAFDIAALDAVSRASPFGPAPSAIVSPDGNVYLHWEFHRDEVFACSTMNARPFILNVQPKAPPEPEPEPSTPSPSSPTQERGIPSNTSETREGALERPAHAPLGG